MYSLELVGCLLRNLVIRSTNEFCICDGTLPKSEARSPMQNLFVEGLGVLEVVEGVEVEEEEVVGVELGVEEVVGVGVVVLLPFIKLSMLALLKAILFLPKAAARLDRRACSLWRVMWCVVTHSKPFPSCVVIT